MRILSSDTADVTGTEPPLTVEIEHSFDNVRWQERHPTPQIDTAREPVTTAETVVQGQDANATTRGTVPYVRLRIRLCDGSILVGQR